MDKKITVDGLNLFYQEYGTGAKPIILLHGWGQSSSFWQEFVNKFSDSYHLYVLDLPGFGQSEEPQNSWQITEYASFLHSFVTMQKISKPIIVGHSFGGRIAILYASQFPVQKLVLYSTGGGLAENSLKTAYRHMFVKLGKHLFPNTLYKSHTAIFRPKNYQNKVSISTKRSKRMLDIYSQPPQDLTEALKKISVKTLIIVGAKDYITSPKIGEQLHKLINGSIFISIPEATHFSHIESPNAFYDEIQKFLKNN